MAFDEPTWDTIEDAARARERTLKRELEATPDWLLRSVHLLLTAEDEHERIAAAQEISRFGQQAATPPVLTALVTAFHQSQPHSPVLEVLISTLAYIGDAAFVQPGLLQSVRGALMGAPSPLREDACWHLGRMNFRYAPQEDQEAGVALLQELASDPSLTPEARAWASAPLPPPASMPIGERIYDFIESLSQLWSGGVPGKSGVLAASRAARLEGEPMTDQEPVSGHSKLHFQILRQESGSTYMELVGEGTEWHQNALRVTFDDGSQRVAVLATEIEAEHFAGKIPLDSREQRVVSAEVWDASQLTEEDFIEVVLTTLEQLEGWPEEEKSGVIAWLAGAPEAVEQWAASVTRVGSDEGNM